MLGIYYIVTLFMAFPIVCDFFIEVCMFTLENSVNAVDDTKFPFPLWLFWKGFKGLVFVFALLCSTFATLIISLLACWIIVPVHVIMNIQKYNPVNWLNKWHEEYHKKKGE